jgi:hypothetical protein
VPYARALQARNVPMLFIWPSSLVGLMLASLAVSYVFHVAIEKPALRLRERLAG